MALERYSWTAILRSVLDFILLDSLSTLLSIPTGDREKSRGWYRGTDSVCWARTGSGSVVTSLDSV